MSNICVLGAGSWGTALAVSLAKRGHDVVIWDRSPARAESIQNSRENTQYLPGVTLPDAVRVTSDMAKAIASAAGGVYVLAVPAQQVRGVLDKACLFLDRNAYIVNLAKGIERGTLLRISEVASEVSDKNGMALQYVVLSGPSHAEEVGLGMPTTVTVAADDHEDAVMIQDMFMSDFFRIYTSDDVTGVELGGALKNIIALGAGISDGMGYGDNAKAAMMTRGITEIARLGVKLGAQQQTFFGLSGIGDLIVTCTSMHSRNRRCGILIGKGMKPEEAVKKVGMVVEGMYTAEAAFELASRVGVEMPITEGIYAVIKGRIDARDAVNALMTRDKKREIR